MKMEAFPELRKETEDGQGTEYEVHHQKLVNAAPQAAQICRLVLCKYADKQRFVCSTCTHTHTLTQSQGSTLSSW